MLTRLEKYFLAILNSPLESPRTTAHAFYPTGSGVSHPREDQVERFSSGCGDAEGNEWTRIKDIKTAFHAALKRANLGDFRFHDLRHTFAALLVMGGVDLATVKDLLGHKDFKMTLRYAHLAPAHKIAALGVLDGQHNGKGPANYTKTIQSNEKEVRAIALTS